MFKNYLRVAFRNLMKNRVHLFINVIGMGLALACCIVAFLNYKFAADYDKNHVNYPSLYKIHTYKASDQDLVPYGITPYALGPLVAEDLSNVNEVVRFTGMGMIVSYGNKVLNQYVAFADPNFLEVFTYPLKLGTPAAFKEKGNILLSEEMAVAYFGEQDPMGKLLKVRDNRNVERSFIVAGVFEKIPLNTSMTFGAVTIMDNYEEFVEMDNEWRAFVAATFLKVDNPDDVTAIPAQLNQYIGIQNEKSPDWKVVDFYLEPLETLGARSETVIANWLNNAPPAPAVIAPAIMALLMLLVAAFNFTNTSIAISLNRLKEIGIRKVVGGSKSQLILQFMGENLLLVFLSILVSLVIANYLVPAYSALWEWQNLQLNLTENLDIYVFLFGLLVFTALVAGSYPSIYVSSFEPVRILKGSLRVAGVGLFSKVLLTLQFGFTIIALFASVAFTQNAIYQNSLDMGYERDLVMGVRLKNNDNYQAYRDALMSNPKINKIAGTRHHIGQWTYSTTMKTESSERDVFMMNFSPEYFDVMDLKMAEGRAFTSELKESDRVNSIIVNQTLVRTFGWDEPIGQRITVGDTTRLTVIGVMKDFYIDDLFRPVDPLGIRVALEEDGFNFLVLEANAQNLTETHAFLEDVWQEVVPDRPFEGFYQDDLLESSQEVNQNIVIIFAFLGFLSIILSGIGLFTMVSLTVIKRIKEIGIRKVMGASVPQILVLLNRSFFPIILSAAVFGLVGGYFLIDMLIGSIFAYYKSIDAITIAVPLVIILIVSLGTSSSRILVAARQNPSKSLRYE